MTYLFDTDTIIFWLKGSQRIEQRSKDYGIDKIAFSIISLAELYFGAHNSEEVEKNLRNIQSVCNTLRLVHFDSAAAMQFGLIKSYLRKEGKPLADADLMIASIAISNNLTLVTNNTKHFSRIEEISIENWVK